MNQQSHICAVFEAMTRSLIGCPHSLKCITEEDQEILTNCVAHVLQNVEIDNAAGDLIMKAVASHHKQYGCSSKTLLTLICYWHQALQKLTEQGIPVGSILPAFHQAVQLAVEHVAQHTIPLSACLQRDTFPESSQDRETRLNQHHTDPFVDSEKIIQQLSTHNRSRTLKSSTGDEFKEISLKLNTKLTREEPKTSSNGNSSLPDSEEIIQQFSTHNPLTTLKCSTGDDFKEINLKLKTKRTCAEPSTANTHSTDSSPDSDVGWFFDDGKVPLPPNFHREVTEVLQSLDIDDPPHTTPRNQPGIRSSYLTAVPNSSSIHQGTNLKQTYDKNVSDDEFDSCFDDVNFERVIEPIQPVINKTQSCCTHMTVENGSRGSSDAEFDTCFDDANFKGGIEPIKPVINMPQSCCTHVAAESGSRGSSDLEFDACFDDHHTQLKSSSQTVGKNKGAKLNEKIQEMLQKKGRMASNSKVINRSRHFKTIDSTVAELNDAVGAIYAETEMTSSANDSCRLTTDEDLPNKMERSGNGFNGLLFDDPTLGQTDKVSDFIEHGFKATSKDISTKAVIGQAESETSSMERTSITNKNGLSELKQIDKLLKNLPKKTSKPIQSDSLSGNLQVNSTSDLLNRSRYFRTIETSVNEVANRNLGRVTAGARSDIILNHDDEQRDTGGDIHGRQHYSKNLTLHCMVEALSHEAEDVVDFVTDLCYKQQTVTNSNFSLDLSCVHTYVAAGPPAEKSAMVEGLVVETSHDQLAVAGRSPGPRNTLLIHGDLDVTFKHKGQQVKQTSTTVGKHLRMESRVTEWLADVRQVLQELSVTAIVCTGSVLPALSEECDSLGIILVSGVKYNVLLALGESCQADIAVYITECTQENVAFPVWLEPYNPAWMDQLPCVWNKPLIAIKPGTSLVQTVVFCHPCRSLVFSREEHFWHTAWRVASCLRGSCLLPGGGATELCSARMLQDFTEKGQDVGSSADTHKLAVYSAVSEGFQRFSDLVKRNSSYHKDSPSGVATCITNTPNQDNNLSGSQEAYNGLCLCNNLSGSQKAMYSGHCTCNNPSGSQQAMRNNKCLCNNFSGSQKAMYNGRYSCNNPSGSREAMYNNRCSCNKQSGSQEAMYDGQCSCNKSSASEGVIYNDKYSCNHPSGSQEAVYSGQCLCIDPRRPQGLTSQCGQGTSAPVFCGTVLPEICDDYESKVNAWQTACHVTCQLLLCNHEIITGLDKSVNGVML